MKHSIKHLFHINASRQKVFEAITTIEGLSNWWTIQTTGDASLGGSIKFEFGEFAGPQMKVITRDKDNKLIWECTESQHGWTGDTFTFVLDENEGKTRICFSHDGWDEQDDFYAICSFTWGRYMESLRQYCQTGKGGAFGSEGYQ